MHYLDFKHGGNVLELQRKYQRKFIDFSANINPLGIPAIVKKCLIKDIDSILHYPSDGGVLKRKIAKFWNVEEENILLGNGSIELIYLLANAFKPKKTNIFVPSFSEYERAARSVGSEICFIKLKESNGFEIGLSPFSKCDMCFIGNPNNPTGNLLLEDKQVLKKLFSSLFVVDEAFMDFLPDQNKVTLIWEAVKNKKVCVLRTFTKYYAIPGLRCGYLIAHKQVVKRLSSFQVLWSVNTLAQGVAEKLLEDNVFKDKTDHIIERERKFLIDKLSEIDGLECYPSKANFLLIKIKDSRWKPNMLQEKLFMRGLLVRDCSNFRSIGKNFIRIAVRLRKENVILVKELKKLLD